MFNKKITKELKEETDLPQEMKIAKPTLNTEHNKTEGKK